MITGAVSQQFFRFIMDKRVVPFFAFLTAFPRHTVSTSVARTKTVETYFGPFDDLPLLVRIQSRKFLTAVYSVRFVAIGTILRSCATVRLTLWLIGDLIL